MDHPWTNVKGPNLVHGMGHRGQAIRTLSHRLEIHSRLSWARRRGWKDSKWTSRIRHVSIRLWTRRKHNLLVGGPLHLSRCPIQEKSQLRAAAYRSIEAHGYRSISYRFTCPYRKEISHVLHQIDSSERYVGHTFDIINRLVCSYQRCSS